ncbi:MAG: DUF4143 domain-containing protein [Burkholderiales bacterium]|nr:DUF4143 domain-containing protein [Burkholderiales bacterium]
MARQCAQAPGQVSEGLQLQPLTAAEQARVPGHFLAALLGGRLKPAVAATAPKAPLALAARVVAGGFPEAVARSAARARTWHREYVRLLLESFVVQQLVAQAGWTDPDLRFWHYRDKDQVEVDLVVTRGRQTWGVEVKSAVTATPADRAGLRRLAAQCGADYRGGVLLYAGDSAFALGDARTFTMPLARLWDM